MKSGFTQKPQSGEVDTQVPMVTNRFWVLVAAAGIALQVMAGPIAIGGLLWLIGTLGPGVGQ